MSTIVAVRDETRAAIVCDTQITSDRIFHGDTKVHQIGDWWVGCTGSVRAERLLLTMPVPTEHTPHILAEAFVSAMREDGQGHVDGNGTRLLDTALIMIPVRGDPALYLVTCDGALIVPARNYYAIGSGGSFASGVCELGLDLGWSPKKIAKRAVEVATRLDVYSGGKLRTYSTNTN